VGILGCAFYVTPTARVLGGRAGANILEGNARHGRMVQIYTCSDMEMVPMSLLLFKGVAALGGHPN